MKRSYLILALALSTSLAHAASAQNASTVQVVDPWARASAGKTGAVYLSLRNGGDAADKLVAVSTPAADRAELHAMSMDGDVMRMRQVDSVAVDPHGATELKPGGFHVMLVELRAPLKMGEPFPMTLRFEKAGEITVQVAVEAAGAMGPGAMGQGGSGRGAAGHNAGGHRGTGHR